MPRLVALAAAAALLGAAVPPGTAFAQSDPAALDLIRRLQPQAGGATRGLRLPGASEATPAPATSAPVQPAAAASVVPAAPGSPPSRGVAPAGARATVAAVPGKATGAAAQPPVVSSDTTAPAGVAAVSMTVMFPTASAALTPEAERALAPLGRALASNDLAAYRFRIEGHTDTVGAADLNQSLSERRAATVREFLVRRYGVDPARLEAVGLGESQPLVPTPEGVAEARNRRVQVLNIGS